MTSQSTLNIRVRIVIRSRHTLLQYSRLEDCTSDFVCVSITCRCKFRHWFSWILWRYTYWEYTENVRVIKNNGNHIKVMKNIETTNFVVIWVYIFNLFYNFKPCKILWIMYNTLCKIILRSNTINWIK